MYRSLKLLLFIFILLGSLAFVGTQFGFVQNVKASPDLEGPNYPTATTTASETPYDDNDWVDAVNVELDDGVYASITRATFDANDYSYVLYATAFGFTIPSGATIDGIVVEIERRCDAGAAIDAVVQLVKGGTRLGNNKADTVTSWPATDTIKSYGGSTDKWGLAWAVTDINAADFGVALAAQATANNADIYVDFIRVTVYYHLPPNIFITPSSVSTERGFHVNIDISNVEDLYTWSLRLSWNQTLFECAKAIEGPFLKQGGSTAFTSKVYNDQGYIYLIDSLMGMVPGVDGSGTLATVYFTSSKNNGNCSLHLYDSTLIKPDMSTITHTTTDGNFDNRGLTLIPAASVYVDPSSVSTERGFTVDIAVSGVTQLNGVEIKLNWNSSLFECAAIKEGPFLKGGGSTWFYPMINNPVGIVMITSRILGTGTVSGSGTLATIYFTSSKNSGNCTIDLEGTSGEFILLDQYKEYWYHTTTDGNFDNRGLTLIPAANVYVDPALTMTTNPFTIDINVSSATEVFSWEFNLAWDSTLIEVTGITEGTFLSAGGTTTFYYQINNVAGTVLVNCTLLAGGTAQSGSGTLATISFGGYKNAGLSAFDLKRPPEDFMLHDSNGMYWYHTVTDGNFDNRPTIYVDPPLVTTSASFNVDIKIRDVVFLNFTEFSLSWNSSLINCTGIAEGTFLSGGGATVFYSSYNNTLGTLLVNVTITTPGGYVNGTGTVATISFGAAKTSGKCDLDLYNTKLEDVFGNVISHKVEDGYYDNTAVPEFPLGAAMEIGLAILVVYVWWKRKRKNGSPNYNRSVKPS